MAVKKKSQNCFYGADCPPEHSCKDGQCVPWPKKPGILGNPSAKIGAGIIGAGLTAAGIKIAKGIKENKPVRKAARENRKAAKSSENLIAKEGGWIKGAIKKPGALREQLGVKKGQTIPKAKLAAAAKKGGKLGQRARLAITLGKMRKK
jgi:hypothetical protein